MSSVCVCVCVCVRVVGFVVSNFVVHMEAVVGALDGAAQVGEVGADEQRAGVCRPFLFTRFILLPVFVVEG